MGFVEYVTKIKMMEAKSLLLSGKYKVYEVSEFVGYEDTSYFIRTFHKVTGLTPKDYLAKYA
jgi:two-component system response regulator YesN